jgi:hypothetical protein
MLASCLHWYALSSKWKVDLVPKDFTSATKPQSLVTTTFFDDLLTYRIDRVTRFRNPAPWYCPPVSPGVSKLLVIIDSDSGVGEVEPRLEFFQNTQANWCIYQMSRPLAEGAMWDRVRLGPVGEDGSQNPERLIVVLTADDLRAEGIELSRHLSWEKVAEDFVSQLASQGRLGALVTCAYLVVRFDCDGVILHRGRDAKPPVLFFDPNRLEGDFAQENHSQMFELTTAFTAGLAAKMAEDGEQSIEDAIKSGFAAARRLAMLGPRPSLFPANDSDILHNLGPDRELSVIEIPSEAIVARSSPWSILDDTTLGGQEEISRHVVQFGPSMALSRVPTSCFGRFVTADRREIETFQSVLNLIREYLAGPRQSRLRIGVFGPPGSGKLFASRQLAETATKDQTVQKFCFDLSQFASTDDLWSSLRSIRDCNLTGFLPLVFFNNFDVEFSGRPLGWLKYLFGPVQEGTFWDQGQLRPLGPAIFFFITNQYETFGEFFDLIDESSGIASNGLFSSYLYVSTEPLSARSGQPQFSQSPDRRASVDATELSKFASSLQGYINVLGPDAVNEDDRMFPIRRALALRSLLKKREPALCRGKRITIDDAVLNGFLGVPSYRYGIQSMNTILRMSSLSGKHEFQRSSLPSEAQLGLHVDAKTFMQLVRAPQLNHALRDTLAQGLYEAYKKQRLKMAKDDEEREALKRDPSFREHWEDLREDLQESTRAQADDIPRKLRLINCYMARTDSGRRPGIPRFSEDELDLLSEREHERWVSERLRKQWRLGQRDPTERKTPFLVPWVDLEKQWRDVDRAMVECVPPLLAEAGYQIYQLEGAFRVKVGSVSLLDDIMKTRDADMI